MNVSIIKDIVSVDENGDEVTTQVATEYVVALDDGVFTATNLILKAPEQIGPI